MTWLNPAAFAFLALIPVVLLLHALRYRRRDVRVSTLFLWESVLREAHGSLGLQRLRTESCRCCCSSCWCVCSLPPWRILC